jgi:hypothetical protein
MVGKVDENVGEFNGMQAKCGGEGARSCREGRGVEEGRRGAGR